MLPEDAGEFLDIASEIRIEFGAEYDQYLPRQQIAVESAVGMGDAIGGYEQIGVVEVFGIRVDEPQLDRPLTQRRSAAAQRAAWGGTGGFPILIKEAFCRASGALPNLASRHL